MNMEKMMEIEQPGNRNWRYYRIAVTVLAAIGLIWWIGYIQLRELSNEARVRVMLACSPGTPKKSVLERLDTPIKPRDYSYESRDNFKDIVVPPGGSVLFYDSYTATDLLVSPGLPEFLVVFDKTDHVTSIVFEEIKDL